MKKPLVFGFVFALCVTCLPAGKVRYALCALYAQPVSSTELINNAKAYDGKVIVYEGEVIGEVMARGGNAWLNVFDGYGAIGIWADGALLKEITHTGSYKSKGDQIEVQGIMQRACAQHGGDLDIHAQSLRKISSGRNMAERLNLDKRNFAAVLTGILFFLWILKPSRRK